jgi:2'-5' RNA ligase
VSRLAIDVVLLPDEPMASYAIDTSKRIAETGRSTIVLSAQNCLPHISLAMGFIEENDVKHIADIVQQLTSATSPLALTADRLQKSIIPSGDTVLQFAIGRSDALQKLHEAVTIALQAFCSHEGTTDMLFSPPPVEEISLHWIRNYREQSSNEHFAPHITLGFGTTESSALPMDFTASTLALCHLGNYCTCRRILASATLGACTNTSHGSGPSSTSRY